MTRCGLRRLMEASRTTAAGPSEAMDEAPFGRLQALRLEIFLQFEDRNPFASFSSAFAQGRRDRS